ncbi:MAG: hypothetical protein K2X32_00210 [Phycisphaerales bacterium]|nr:hypothetical protein [Phycisphaerales bacterium]
MIVSPNTSVEEFIEYTKWEFMYPGERESLGEAFNFFMRTVPLARLNYPDHSSPWTPGPGPRTTLISWLQAINLRNKVNPRCVLEEGTQLKQFRFPGDDASAQGSWFTYPPTGFSGMALPAGQEDERLFVVAARIICLESTVGDAYMGWVAGPQPAYGRGGAKQLFIDNRGPFARNLTLAPPAKPIK